MQIIGGARLQRLQSANYLHERPAEANGADQTVVSPSVSFVVKPIKEVMIYGNYIQALQQGPTAGAGLTNAGQTFPPFVTNQFEARREGRFRNFGATLSAFQITLPSSFTDISTNTLVTDGQQRNRGIEFVAFGEPLPGLKFLGGFTLLDAKLTSTAGGLNNGNTAVGTAPFQVAAGPRLGYTLRQGARDLGPRRLQRPSLSQSCQHTGGATLDALRCRPALYLRARRRQANFAARQRHQSLRCQLLGRDDGVLRPEPAAHLHAVVDRRLLETGWSAKPLLPHPSAPVEWFCVCWRSSLAAMRRPPRSFAAGAVTLPLLGVARSDALTLCGILGFLIYLALALWAAAERRLALLIVTLLALTVGGAAVAALISLLGEGLTWSRRFDSR